MWIIIDDKKSRQVWMCRHCGDEVNVYPPEYEDIGTPVCEECGLDMFYRHTEYNDG